MTLSPTRHRLPMYLDTIDVLDRARLSPTFVRITFTSPTLGEFGVADGDLLDQRIKLVFPTDDGTLPSFDGADETWLHTWLQRPVSERGHMRTFTVRHFVSDGPRSRLVVDFALHDGPDAGPAARWASRATVGDRLVVLGPALGQPYGGIEFLPGDAREIVLVGDETAVPAVGAIFDSGLTARTATAFLEVPTSDDILEVSVPEGCTLTWLPRDGRERGILLREAVAAHFEAPPVGPVEFGDVDPDLWETPAYSSSGEELPAADPTGSDARTPEPYVWVAGESRTVTAIRRHLISEVGLDRSQVAFMGYWREGVAMRS